MLDMIFDLINRIKRKWMRMRLQPIRVYCLHHVCATFDTKSMNACDWMEIGKFKNKVLTLRNDGIEFISLKDAYLHICNDKLRFKKYAVLTFDDGYASLKEIIPWLEYQKIPFTLFINGMYLDGTSYRKNPKEQYLTQKELWTLTSPLIEVGSHGWSHTSVFDMKDDVFIEAEKQNIKLLSTHPNYIPFMAYAYGNHKKSIDNYLMSQQIVPVYIEGKKNYNNKTKIDREFLK